MQKGLILFISLLLLASEVFAGGYVDNEDGTVTDWTTGLMWPLCFMGRSGQGCTFTTVQTTDWASALDYCENQIGNSGTFAGYSDWRLPNVNELASLIDYDPDTPFIDPVFPLFPTLGYWSSTSYQFNLSEAWAVSFNTGIVAKVVKNGPALYHARCVRSEP